MTKSFSWQLLSRVRFLVCLSWIVPGFWALSVDAHDTLPYSLRTQPYNGAFSVVTGDIRTVGMAGSVTGLADTFLAGLDNPAGLAMTVQGASSSFVSNFIQDEAVQSADAVNSFHLGLAWSDYPWGFSFGYSTPYQEGKTYLVTTTPNDPVELNVGVKEFYFSVARVLFNHRLSLGASLIFGQGEESIQFSQASNLSYVATGSGVRASFGAMGQLGKRFLLGLSYQIPIRYDINPTFIHSPGFPGFFQPIEIPWRASLGLGWIPNRFFRANLSLAMTGISHGTALLKDNSMAVGQSLTLQPRLGAAYVFSDYKELTGTLFLGTYYEMSRVQGASHRMHGTLGVEVNPWIFQFGSAIDLAANYRNYLLYIGVDVVKVFTKLDFVPEGWKPPSHGFLPNPQTYSDEGLSRPLSVEWKDHGPKLNPIEVGLNVPKKVEAKFKEVREQVKEAFETPFDRKRTPAAKKKSARKRRSKH